MTPAGLALVQQRLQLAARMLGDVAALQEGLRHLNSMDDAATLAAKIQLPIGEWLTVPVSVGELRARLQAELGQQMAGALAETRRAAGDLVPVSEEEGQAA